MTLLLASLQRPGPWKARGAAVLLWALGAASLAYWGLRITAPPPGPAAARAVAADNAPARQAVARLLGAAPAAAARQDAAPHAAQRFALLGVIASVTGKGAALISVDGLPARPLAVGAQVAPGYVLQAVSRRQAVVASGAQAPEQIILSLPALAPPAAAGPLPAARPASLSAAPAAVVDNNAAPLIAAPLPAAEPRDPSEPPARQDSRYQTPAPLRR